MTSESRGGGKVPSGKRFSRGVAVLVSGTAGAQAVIMVAAPLITRLYTPEDYGRLAVFSALLAVIAVIACLRYELAIPLPEDEAEASNLLGLGLISTAGIALLVLLLVALFGEELATHLNEPSLGTFLWLLPLGVLLTGFYRAGEKWAVRRQAFGILARTKFTQAISSVLIQLASFKVGTFGLIAGQVAGQGAGTGRLGLLALDAPTLRAMNWVGMRDVAIRYREFPIYSTWTAMFNMAGLQFAPVVLVALFGAGTAGLYALTLRILTVPSSVIGGAVANVFLAHAADAYREGKLGELVESLHEKLAKAGVPVLVLILVAGPELFALVFGEEWRKAGLYAQWMAPWIYWQFQWSPLSMMENVIGLQRVALLAQGLSLIVRVVALLACAWAGSSAETAVLVFAVVSATVYLVRMLWFMSRVHVSPLSIIGSETKWILFFLSICSPAIFGFIVGGVLWNGIAAIWFLSVTVWWYFWQLRKHQSSANGRQ